MRTRSPLVVALGVVFATLLLAAQQVQGQAVTLLPQSNRGECLGVLVDERVVLLPAHCAESLGKSGNSNKVAIFGNTASDIRKVQIQRFKIHPLYRSGEVSFDFALGFADPSASFNGYSELRLDRYSTFQSQAEDPQTEDLSVYSVRQAETDRNELTLTRGRVAFASSSACGAESSGSGASSSVGCLIGTWNDNAECDDNFSGHQIIVRTMRFGTVGLDDQDYLSGFVSRSSRCSDAGSQVFAFNHFNNSLEFVERELEYLDFNSYDPVPVGEASGGDSSASGSSSLAGRDPIEYEKQLVTFYDGLAPLNCSGGLIAPRFFLTTATCVSSHNITHVVFGRTGEPQVVQSNRTVLHPQFTSGYSRFDVALLELQSPLPTTPISLSSEPGLVGDKLVRVGHDGVADQVAIDELSKCPSTGLSLAPSDADSGALACVAQTLPGSGSGPRGGDSSLIQKSQGKLLLKGVELPVKSCLEGSQCYSGIYVSISGLANFINAFASGQLWDFQAPTPEPTPAPTPMPTRTPVPCVWCLPPVTPPSPPPVPTPAPSSPIYPYVVGLRVEKEGQNFCGGVLIDFFHVLTAAHCVEDGIASWVSVGSPTSSGSDPQSIAVARVLIHPQYKSKRMVNDAAVLELQYYASSTKLPGLDTLSDHPDKTAATMLSVGTTSSNVLKAVGVPIWPRKRCEAQYPTVDGSIVCAGGVVGIDACSGDSGSPLIVKDAGGNDVLVGLVSSGFECGLPGMPGFYTRVSTIREFVKNHAFLDLLPQPAESTSQPGFTPTTRPTPAAITPDLPPSTDTSAPPTSSTAKPSGGGSKSTGNTPRTDGSLKSDATSRAPSPTSSDTPITAVRLDDDLSTVTQQKVLNVFIGDSSLVSSTLFAKLVSPDKQVMLLSTGDVQGIIAAINRNSALPLNQRADRFGTMVDRRQAASSDTCASQ